MECMLYFKLLVFLKYYTMFLLYRNKDYMLNILNDNLNWKCYYCIGDCLDLLLWFLYLLFIV